MFINDTVKVVSCDSPGWSCVAQGSVRKPTGYQDGEESICTSLLQDEVSKCTGEPGSNLLLH